ncbi:uncharacterized protein ASPGLDRAFT_81462 [Aspergillus glaucus CBS 516.65]|uniref:Catalase core domain-containing protein n=1 Tax=Aspergillus glaucus CBS 516.65 TaxID=1160497 RepID=A0A1L9VPK1_ASPGL|nr:hypothetical protein ASPGLDRAFT_81462 [Aspergillus glaucus CBS 516.65]OJJ85810.1 hypothetical protein ASPGLDRAFT_81462 [Aspergillus glaucus CBS 516.65]
MSYYTLAEGCPYARNNTSVQVRNRSGGGLVLLQDTQLIESLAHFSRERIPERQIKKFLGESDVEGCDADSSANEDWELPTPEYVFSEQARLMENFYGPDAENFDEDKLLARRIQVTKDMVALLRLCEPPRRGNRVNWNFDDGDDELLEQPEEPASSEEDTLVCPTDVCIICCGVSRSAPNPPPHKFSSKRKDSLRRHLIESHLVHAHDGISCNWEAYGNMPKFSKVTEFLAHAAQVHAYDIKIKLCHLPQSPQIACSAISSIYNSEVSSECDSQPKSETPASSVGFEITNIDPRLLEPQTVNMEAPSNQPGTDTLMSSIGSGVTKITPCSTEIATRRKTTKRAAKAASSKPEPQRQHTTRSSLHHDHSEAQPGVLKSSSVKPLLRRSKRLKS